MSWNLRNKNVPISKASGPVKSSSQSSPGNSVLKECPQTTPTNRRIKTFEFINNFSDSNQDNNVFLDNEVTMLKNKLAERDSKISEMSLMR